jgi:hypothetical protein
MGYDDRGLSSQMLTKGVLDTYTDSNARERRPCATQAINTTHAINTTQAMSSAHHVIKAFLSAVAERLHITDMRLMV